MSATGNFDGVDFEIESRPVSGSAGSNVSVRPIPGGDNAYVDLGGQLPKKRRYRIYTATVAAFAALEAKRGSQGTLTTTAFGTCTAILENVDWDDQAPGGETNGYAEFTLL